MKKKSSSGTVKVKAYTRSAPKKKFKNSSFTETVRGQKFKTTLDPFGNVIKTIKVK